MPRILAKAIRARDVQGALEEHETEETVGVCGRATPHRDLSVAEGWYVLSGNDASAQLHRRLDVMRIIPVLRLGPRDEIAEVGRPQ